MLLDIFYNRLNTDCTFIIEADTAITNQPRTVQKIINDHGFENIQFKLAHGSTDVDGNIIAQYLCADHRQCFTLGRIYLTWHDGRSGLIIRNEKFADSTSRT